MSASSEHGSTRMWDKFKTSTKSISSSLSQLSIKPETDGSTPTSTVVHKALVKFYKHQEPFQGFPGWLGHKEDLPDEQKILKKQQNHQSKSSRTGDSITSKFDSLRGGFSEKREERPDAASQRTTAGMSFHSIYDKPTSSTDLSSMASPSVRSLLRARSTWSSEADSAKISSAGTNSTAESNNGSAMDPQNMMRARLLRRNTRPLNNI